MTHSAQISTLAKRVASGPDGRLRSDLPPAVAARLVGNTPLPLLVQAVTIALGRTDTATGSRAAPSEAPSEPAKQSTKQPTKTPRRRRRRGPRPQS
ncbi:MAG: hypothetical protein AAF449_09565 [Myxococcota bacterium]